MTGFRLARLRTLKLDTPAMPLLRSIGGVGGAAALSQAAALMAAPILARLYSPEAFGQLGAIVAFSNIAATVLLFGLGDAILAALTLRDASRLFAAASQILLASLVPLAILAWVFISQGLFGLGKLPFYTLPPILILVAALVWGSLLQSYLVRAKTFSALAQSYLLLGWSRAAIQIGTGAVTRSFLGLVGGEVVGRIGADIVMIRAMRGRFLQIVGQSRQRWTGTLKAYRHFPIQRTPSAVLSAIAVGAPVLMITSLYGVSEAGQFSLMFTLLMGPLAIIQRAVGDVFTGHFGAMLRVDKARSVRFLFLISSLLLTAGIVGAVLLIFFAEPTVVFFLGEEWRLTGRLAAVVAPMIGIMVLVLPISQVLIVTHRPELKLVFDVLYASGLAALYLLADGGDIAFTAFVSIYTAISATAYALFLPLISLAVWRPRLSRAA